MPVLNPIEQYGRAAGSEAPELLAAALSSACATPISTGR
jgi:hypothetical protein